tara:strand:+ start:598 stop:1596 length:999 start_codon:yes stop_codon:yes gene_type:complete
MNILITGVAGFIGFHLAQTLLQKGHNVIGVDNLNDYYDTNLKESRLKQIKLENNSKNFLFLKESIANNKVVQQIFGDHDLDIVINLAAQAGVRYSLENPYAYVDSNLTGFVNILEGCRYSKIRHLVYASSSSVYGMNNKQPFSTSDRVDYPVSLYAATKRSNELMAHAYSHLYDIPCTGLRFFTVYGPYGRPDMAYFKFTEAILKSKKIDVYNKGQMKRDFTYIDDIVNGIMKVIDKIPDREINEYSNAYSRSKIYNIGNNNPISLNKFINAIEKACDKDAILNMLPMQAGDVPITFADIDDLYEAIEFKPSTSIDDGILMFVNWYKEYNNV